MWLQDLVFWSRMRPNVAFGASHAPNVAFGASNGRRGPDFGGGPGFAPLGNTDNYRSYFPVG
ncbi:hypothetical protein H4696_004853 [Amycolatopsis lexingtonensis]|uniref:Uncharacterized protein n=1 Tax=Amycolatopsis lexingtonensis TaxID=218822 RepID=A0ABR9I3I6_9PSEU|nr:hypothetical protein [Amycolatopsis lexingtonensis]